MGLYRVMLVDDEEDVRQAIARKINWEEIGFQVVASAENGQEALNFADNADAKLETITELLHAAGDNKEWLGFNRLLDSNIRKTSV